MRINPITGQPKQKPVEPYPVSNQVISIPGGFNPQRYYDKSRIDALLAGLGGGATISVDTRTNILDSTPAEPGIALAEDTLQFLVWDGTTWHVASIGLSAESPNPDMGYTQDSDKGGYTKTSITNKKLYNMTLQGNVNPENGAIRVDTTQTPNRFQVYLRGQWNTYYDDFTIENNDLRHTPLDKQIYVWRGDSVEVGLNGRSIIQEYQVSMGAFPPPVLIDGGTF